MKKIILISVVALFSLSIGAQNEYFANNPTWVCFHEADPYPCVLQDSLNYYLNGDSIINSMTYKILYTKGHFMEFAQGPPSPFCTQQNYTYQNSIPTGYLRSQGMQIYYIPEQDSIEYLLYDFNLSVGWHVPLTYLNNDTTFTVTSIDSIFTAAGYRQRYFLNGNSTDYLVEGIGSSAGLLYGLGLLFEQNASMICYSQNDTAWFPSQGPGCSIITAVAEQTQEEFSFELVPDPATDYFEVLAHGGSAETICIYDALGRCVISQENTSNIFVGNLSRGVYTCAITSGATLVTKRLILN
jgi:hypothetical protein